MLAALVRESNLMTTGSRKHGIEVVPPAYVTSPHGVDAQPGEDVPWWTPSWGDVFRHLGWRWLYFLPAICVLLGLLVLPLRPRYWQIYLVAIKPLFFIVALPTAMAIRAMKTIVKNRKEPFCIHCGYTLLGLADGHRCPECGRRFSLATIDEYRRDPHWFVQRWKAMHVISISDGSFEAGKIRRAKSRDGT
jgi:hypothetical protein